MVSKLEHINITIGFKISAQNFQREFQVTRGSDKTQRITMFVVALPPKTFGVRLADFVCFEKGFTRTWQDLPTCHRHSFQGGLVVQSQFNAVHISVVFITTVVTHIFQLQNCVCGERRI
jgi:ABC-type amino acid transport system permease subunit